MTHTGEVSGGFVTDWKAITDICCRKCKSNNVFERAWESSCGGYEDYKYKCEDCGYYWWIEGSDA